MRRNRARYLFSFAAGASLLMSLATCGLWLRSHRYEDGVRVISARGVRYVILYSTAGQIMVGGSTVPMAPRVWPNGVYHRVEGEPGPFEHSPSGGMLFDRWGFGMHAEQPPYLVAPFSIWFPHWFAAIVLSALPASWLVKRVARRRRARGGLCAACGYDLRGTPNRCPECGAVPGTAGIVSERCEHRRFN